MSNGDFINNGNKNKDTENQPEEKQTQQEKNYLFFYIALGCFAVGAVLFVLAFLIKYAGTYMLYASMISELACITFLNAQKRKHDFKWLKIVRIASYVVIGVALAVIIIGVAVVQK